MTIAIAGAGSIGGYVGGLLALGGHRIRMLARPGMIAELVSGMRLTSHEGLDETIPPARLEASDDPAILGGADIVLVTVKSGGTEEMARLVAAHAPPAAIIVSLQNGIGNAALLQTALPGRDVRAGMVPFNVVRMDGGRFHRGTSGDIVIGTGPRQIATALNVPHLKVREADDIEAILWGKLLLNLNNALNALSGLTLYEQLSNRSWRGLIARQMDEALTVLKAAGIEPAKATPLPPRLVPPLLRLPTPVFRLLSGRMLKIDRQARSSMWEDLERGRKTEIGVLQGAVEALARERGISVPLISRVSSLIMKTELKNSGSPCLTPQEVAEPRH